MGYSFNIGGNDFVKSQKSGINASYKQLSMVCNAIRYCRVTKAIDTVDKIIAMKTPILFPKYNKHMGARHELGGRKGAYPIKAAKEVRTVLENALANAQGKGIGSAEEMFIVHAAANKVQTISRQPSKGSISWGRGMYGRSAMMHSNIELSKVEIVLGTGEEKELSKSMKYFIKKLDRKIRNPINKGGKVSKKSALPKTVDITNPAQVKKLSEGLKSEIAKKGAEKKQEQQHAHTHEHHEEHVHSDETHKHEHSHESHEHTHPGNAHDHKTVEKTQ